MRGSITRRGKDSWRIKYEGPRDPATGGRKTLYKTVRGKRADAERALTSTLHQRDKGISIDPSTITVSAYMDEWFKNVAPQTVGGRALQSYKSISETHIKPKLGHIQIQKLRPMEVSMWLQGLIAGKKLSTKSIRHAHGVLRTALRYAASIEIVERNVASLVKSPSLHKKEIEILTSDQIADVLDNLKTHRSLYPIVVLAWATGARRGELCGLNWSDVNFTKRTLRIERSLEQTKEGLRIKSPKTAAGRRTIGLPEIAIDVLKEHRRKQLELRLALGLGTLPADHPVFGKIEGGWLPPDSLSWRWREAVINRKLPKVTFHALRHSHASALIAARLDLVSVSKRLGHASPLITLGTYAHLFENRDDQAAAAIDAVMRK